MKRLPVMLRSRAFNVAVVSLKGRTISPVAQLFTDQAKTVGAQIAKSRKASGAV